MLGTSRYPTKSKFYIARNLMNSNLSFLCLRKCIYFDYLKLHVTMETDPNPEHQITFENAATVYVSYFRYALFLAVQEISSSGSRCVIGEL
jgi:hypothetical protein